MTGRIDVHSHLLPGIDDGCKPTRIGRARADPRGERLTHSFCTPHIWSNLPNNSVVNIPKWLQRSKPNWMRKTLPLKLFPGGELNNPARPVPHDRRWIVSFRDESQSSA